MVSVSEMVNTDPPSFDGTLATADYLPPSHPIPTMLLCHTLHALLHDHRGHLCGLPLTWQLHLQHLFDISTITPLTTTSTPLPFLLFLMKLSHLSGLGTGIRSTLGCTPPQAGLTRNRLKNVEVEKRTFKAV